MCVTNFKIAFPVKTIRQRLKRLDYKKNLTNLRPAKHCDLDRESLS